jgi:lipid-A-disaccharide synthase-like uncharacterized protein
MPGGLTSETMRHRRVAHHADLVLMGTELTGDRIVPVSTSYTRPPSDLPSGMDEKKIKAADAALRQELEDSADSADSLAAIHATGAMANFFMAVASLVISQVYRRTSINMTTFSSLSMSATDYPMFVTSVSIPLGEFSGGTVSMLMQLIATLYMLVNCVSCRAYAVYTREVVKSESPILDKNGSFVGDVGRKTTAWFNYGYFQFVQLGMHNQTLIPAGLVFALGSLLSVAAMGINNVLGESSVLAYTFMGGLILSQCQTATRVTLGEYSVSDPLIAIMGCIGALIFSAPWWQAAFMMSSLAYASGVSAVPDFFWGLTFVGFVMTVAYAAPSIIAFKWPQPPVRIEFYHTAVVTMFNLFVALAFYLGSVIENNADQIKGIHELIQNP